MRNLEEKRKFYELVRKSNKNTFKKWYKLKDLVELKNISYKSLKNMVKSIYEKHSKTGLIYKKGRRYYISYLILDEFSLKQPRKNKSLNWYSHNWLANISYSTKEFYDLDYHEFIINKIREIFPKVNFLSAVEEDSKSRLHVHMLADKEPAFLKNIIESILTYFIGKEYSFYCEEVQLKGASIDYLRKQTQLII